MIKSAMVIILSVLAFSGFALAQQQPPQQQPPPTQPPATPRPTTTPIKTLSPSPAATPSPQTTGLTEEPASTLGYAAYALYAAAAGAGVFFIGFLGWWFRRKKTAPLPAEDDGTVCGTCGGTGKVTKKRWRSIPCGHCKGTGLDICHHCGGTGRYGVGLTVPETQADVENFMKCDYCRGKGFPKIPVTCHECKGNRKIEFEESYQEACPTCKGTGRIAK